ncbi:NDT80 / PhoG like DNA-binding family protein [Drechmeria coniospora]|uniref:NDT80 / PhoG like DNA-binding family protein n=1 Tax=Drechmeria coniospora TaxID=98403 RepID=A0A151GQI0_DRECN|nr:NDT80 / PhoG like DNA-binding family protein [Drechmeria coniospora]KYK59359.1 NDT80 / PhoG like DNA-binding family protein [Drechmeria coniospora]
MAQAQIHAHRTGALPQIGPHVSARDQYSTATPSFRRTSEHLSRSPTFPGALLRRHQLTTSPSTLTGFAPPATRMESSQYGTRPVHQQPAPPLQPLQALGSLSYIDSALTPIKMEINGAVDKGPFLSSDQEWTCYRRNYLACVCSYQLTPWYPNMPIQFTPTSTSTSNPSQGLQVYGFAMTISAVVAENEQQNIELVQHTPKRDKGPISKPSRVPMVPKVGASSHHSMSIYGDGTAGPGGARGLYADSFGAPQTSSQQLPAEHTFERIQFKQATQNNGKRRAAQQYYHLIVELWADVGSHSPDQFVKVAFRKSAKMIVRGRSPGHYQNERRGSQGNGPGGSAGAIGGYPLGHIGDFNSSAIIGGAGSGAGAGAFAATYDKYDNRYGNARQQEANEDAMMSPEEVKPMDASRTCQYYSGATYDGHHDRADMFNHRNASDPTMATIAPDGKQVKSEFEVNLLPRPFNNSAPRVMTDPRSNDQYDSKGTSSSYFPSTISPTGMSMG